MTALRRSWAALVVAVAAGCGGGRATPREALESLRSALSTRDAVALEAMTDADSVAHRRAEVRERRAMLERGDDPGVALMGMPLTADEMRRGSEADASALLLGKRSPLFAESKWLGTATVTAEQADGADSVRVSLRGVDGVERDVWFHREDGRWCYDQFRTRRTWR